MTCVCRVGGIGRREGLKIPWSKGRAGSSPAPGTMRVLRNKNSFFYSFYVIIVYVRRVLIWQQKLVRKMIKL